MHGVILGASDWFPNMTITHVNKACIACDWESYKTKLPDKIRPVN